jgi:hypothetical protein
MSRGGTYTDKDGNVVSVNTNGGGVSMVSSSSGGANVQMNGCSIVVSLFFIKENIDPDWTQNLYLIFS